MELIAPPNDSDSRSEADSVGSGGRLSSIEGVEGSGGGGAIFLGGFATAGGFLTAGTGFTAGADFGAETGEVGNEINATSIARKGCSFSE